MTPSWASLMPHHLRILFYETFQTRCLFALTRTTYFDKREVFILRTNFFCEAKVSSWEETALKTDFGQNIVCLEKNYILPICIYINIYIYIGTHNKWCFNNPFSVQMVSKKALNLLPKIKLNMFSETLEHFTGHKKMTVYVIAVKILHVNWK